MVSVRDIDYDTIAAVLKNGGVLVYPTDTAYALGCDATSEQGVANIFEIKKRDRGKTLSMIVGDRAMAEEWLVFSPTARALAEKYWPGPLGLALPVRKPGLRPETVQDGYAAVRVPREPVSARIAQVAGVPIISTSANTSGAGPQYTIADVLDSLGDRTTHVTQIIDAGELKNGGVSTIVKVCDTAIEVLREGVITIEK